MWVDGGKLEDHNADLLIDNIIGHMHQWYHHVAKSSQDWNVEEKWNGNGWEVGAAGSLCLFSAWSLEPQNH